MIVQSIQNFFNIAPGQIRKDASEPALNPAGQTGDREESNSGRKGSVVAETSPRQSVRASVRSALQELKPESGGRVSLNDILQGKDELLKTFEADVREYLGTVGVNDDAEFSLGFNPVTGRMTVSSSHEQRELIERFLPANQTLSKDFARINVLAGLASVMQSAGMPPKKSIRPDDLDAALSDEALQRIATNPLYVRFEQDGVKSFLGLSKTI